VPSVSTICDLRFIARQNIVLVSLIVALPLMASAQTSGAGPTIVLADQAKYGAAPSPYPAGAEMAVLSGDPSKAGSQYTVRLRLPDGAKINAHTHGDIENVTVLSGTLMVGVGKSFDASKMLALSAGSYASIPIGTPHYAMAKGATVLQVNGVGPASMEPENSRLRLGSHPHVKTGIELHRPNRSPVNSKTDVIAAKQARVIDGRALEAQTAQGVLSEPVPPEMLRRIVEVATLGPTSSNSQPMRIVFVESAEGKERLRPALSGGNVGKTMEAPVTAIIASDTKWYEYNPRIFPIGKYDPANFESPERRDIVRQAALMNATLGGAYLMIVARGFGLDVGPMGGFDRAAVDAEFFTDGRFVTIWLCNLGYADDAKVRARNPRLGFSEVASFV
jgi:3-hydroxypropanoate dehydrogenase